MQEPKFIQFHEHLYSRGHTKRFDTQRMLTALREMDIRLIVNLAPSVDPLLQAAARMTGLEYWHAPLSDGINVDPEQILPIVNRVVSFIKDGCSVLVHCNAGRNRTGLIVVLVLAEVTQYPIGDIIANARNIRPGLLANETFEHFAFRYESDTYNGGLQQ